MNRLERKVKEIIEENGGAGFAQDILEFGCQSGFVTELVTYQQTHSFFDEYYEEIDQLRQDYEERNRMNLRIKGDLKNWLTWWAFEYVTFRLYA